MKQAFLLFLLLFSFFSTISSIRVKRGRRMNSKHISNKKVKDMKNNVIYQFLLGFLSELSGQPGFIDECSKEASGWESVGHNEEKETKLEGNLKQTSSTFTTILGMLGKVLDLVCGFKDKIITFLTGASRRYMRLFIQGKIKRKFKWGVSDMWDSIKSTATTVGNTIVSGASKIKDSVVEGVKWAGKTADEAIGYIKTKIETVLKPIYDLFEKIKSSLIEYLEKNEIMKKILDFSKCFIKNKGVTGIKTLFNAVSSIVTLVPKLTTPAGWVELVVNLICGWEALKDAIKYLVQGLSEGKKPIKYNYFGKFTGKLFEAVSG